jgi:hypothetical protein
MLNVREAELFACYKFDNLPHVQHSSLYYICMQFYSHSRPITFGLGRALHRGPMTGDDDSGAACSVLTLPPF